jgi:hypothetical protein
VGVTSGKRRNITDRVGGAVLRLWHVEVFEDNLFNSEALFCGQVEGARRSRNNRLGVLGSTADEGANSTKAATVETATSILCIPNFHDR